MGRKQRRKAHESTSSNGEGMNPLATSSVGREDRTCHRCRMSVVTNFSGACPSRNYQIILSEDSLAADLNIESQSLRRPPTLDGVEAKTLLIGRNAGSDKYADAEIGEYRISVYRTSFGILALTIVLAFAVVPFVWHLVPIGCHPPIMSTGFIALIVFLLVPRVCRSCLRAATRGIRKVTISEEGVVLSGFWVGSRNFRWRDIRKITLRNEVSLPFNSRQPRHEGFCYRVDFIEGSQLNVTDIWCRQSVLGSSIVRRFVESCNARQRDFLPFGAIPSVPSGINDHVWDRHESTSAPHVDDLNRQTDRLRGGGFAFSLLFALIGPAALVAGLVNGKPMGETTEYDVVAGCGTFSVGVLGSVLWWPGLKRRK